MQEASSRLLSSCLNAAAPERMLTGKFRKTKHSTRMALVPVSSKGGTLNATMYATPSTVPGIAKESIEENSNTACPLNLTRTTRKAISKPSKAVSGAAYPANLTVVQNDGQAIPLQIRPCSPQCSEKAV